VIKISKFVTILHHYKELERKLCW